MLPSTYIDIQYTYVYVYVVLCFYIMDSWLHGECLLSILYVVFHNCLFVCIRYLFTAASASYERACRIAREWEGPEALKQQVSALSVAVNNLSLVAAKDQWLQVYLGGRSKEASKTVGPLVKDLNEVTQEGLVALGLSKVKAKQSVRLTPVTS